MQEDIKLSFRSFNADVIPKFAAEKKVLESTTGYDTMNEGRTISLRYRHGNTGGDPTSKLFANNANFNLPSLLQSQTRLKAPLKAASQLKKDVSVEIAAPFTIMSYRPEKLDAVNKASLKTQQLTRTRKASKTFAGSNPRWKSKQPDLPNRASDYPDPLFKASKSFLARISELSQLELETVKLEKTKKLKKKKPADI